MASLFRYRCVFRAALIGLVPAVATMTSPSLAQVSRSIPSRAYETGKAFLYQGEYRDAEKWFERELRGAIKTTRSRWIDSICYHAMLGETYFFQGRNAESLRQFNRACELYLAFPQWMLQVNFPAIRPSAHSSRTIAPWGKTTRANVAYGVLPNAMSIRMGELVTEQSLQRGGAIMPAQQWTMDVKEIVRCTILAIRRRNELLGPLAEIDPLSNRVAVQLSRGGAPPNHWSSKWVDLAQGVAQAGIGQLEQARRCLQSALLVGRQYDHPLTCVAMLEQGRMAMKAGDLASASRLFEEAGYSAYYYEDYGVIDEALALGACVHCMANVKNIYPALDAASIWAGRKRWRHIQGRLLLQKAENLAILGLAAEADTVLRGDATRIIGRSKMRGGRLAGRFQYVAAWVAYQLNRPKPGDIALKDALAFGANSGLWNFRISLLDSLLDDRSIRPRQAATLYKLLLRDPVSTDWTSQPLESLSVLTTPHHDAYDRWFASALSLQKTEDAFEIADLAKRHRFYSGLPLGGRLLALRGILDANPRQLVGDPALQRQDLLVRYPKYDQLTVESRTLRRELRNASLAPVDSADERKLLSQMKKWNLLAAEREVFLRQIALSRQGADMIFPPRISTADLQKHLKPGQVLVAFHASGNRLVGFALSADNYSVWEVAPTARLQKDVAELLKVLGNHDANRAVKTEVLASDAWRESATVAYDVFLKPARLDFDRIKELIIVPDGLLWYVPFETLLEDGADDGLPLLARMKIRYTPTAGLSVGVDRMPRQIMRTGIVSGRLYPRDDQKTGEAAAEELAKALAGADILPLPTVGPTRLNAALLDQLVVLADVENDPTQPFGWSPIPAQSRRAGETLGQWLVLPGGGPEVILLPGFHTLAESGMRRNVGKATPGHEMFISICSLMARGSRTVLISRWRTGGRTSLDLIREFAQELPHSSATEAWQRSVLLAIESPVDHEQEPRVDRPTKDVELKAGHPFFWAGYLLADTGRTDDEEEKKPEKE